MILRNALDALASVLLPAPCRLCGQTLTSASRIPICTPCLDSFERIAEPMCRCCGRPFVSAVAAQAIDPLCRLCRANFYAFDQARTFAIYGDALSFTITLLKYEEVTRLGDWFAARLAEVFSRVAGDWRPNVIIPVPLFPDRLRERGYNQSDLIARPLAKRLGLRLDSRILMRTKPRPPQLLLSRNERWKSVRGAYATREGLRVDNLRVLLIDDVLTTGATLDSCARTLKKAGAAAVFGLTVARIVPGWVSRGPVAAAPSQAVSGNRMVAKSISSTVPTQHRKAQNGGRQCE
ncbi:MAG: ComF family protein [Candidatus Acidiferrales bacterium]